MQICIKYSFPVSFSKCGILFVNWKKNMSKMKTKIGIGPLESIIVEWTKRVAQVWLLFDTLYCLVYWLGILHRIPKKAQLCQKLGWTCPFCGIACGMAQRVHAISNLLPTGRNVEMQFVTENIVWGMVANQDGIDNVPKVGKVTATSSAICPSYSSTMTIKYPWQQQKALLGSP